MEMVAKLGRVAERERRCPLVDGDRLEFNFTRTKKDRGEEGLRRDGGKFHARMPVRMERPFPPLVDFLPVEPVPMDFLPGDFLPMESVPVTSNRVGLVGVEPGPPYVFVLPSWGLPARGSSVRGSSVRRNPLYGMPTTRGLVGRMRVKTIVVWLRHHVQGEPAPVRPGKQKRESR